MAPPQDSDIGGQGGGSSSSDFVKKLYRMLEEPVKSDIVCWNSDGTSFIVKDNDRFTKEILPQHFKHSNFASFVRQLNKYDFHKVRNTDESSQYGPNAWEFKHNDFRMGQSHNCDIIKRKAPAPRKAAAIESGYTSDHHVGIMNETLNALGCQIQSLSEANTNIIQANKLLVEELLGQQKQMKAVVQVVREVMNHMENQDERRRNTKHTNASTGSGQGFTAGGISMLPDSQDEPAPELRRAREMLQNLAPLVETASSTTALERLAMSYQHHVASPPESTTSSAALLSQQQALNMPFPLGVDMFADTKSAVYPIGQTQGIDPFHADHINNIPYSQPPAMGALEAHGQNSPPPPGASAAATWETKPNILLVEDDKICQRIGSKFLAHFGCEVDTAINGIDAISKLNSNPHKYHLIFMDIIMPDMDGVSATWSIRQSGVTDIPIIAMTSNFRHEDVMTYFTYGMNDCLAKPFTKEGMVKIVKKNLPHMLKDPTAQHVEDSAFAGEVAGQPATSVPPVGFTPTAVAPMLLPPTVTMPQPLGSPAGHTMQHHVSAPPQPRHALKFESPTGTQMPSVPMPSPPVKFEANGTHSPATTTGAWASPMMAQNPPSLDSHGGFMMAAAGGSQRQPVGYGGIVAMPNGMAGPSNIADPTGSHGPMSSSAMNRLPEGMGGTNMQLPPMPDRQSLTQYSGPGAPAQRFIEPPIDQRSEKRQRIHAGPSGFQ